MTTPTYTPTNTALLMVDPYNDFMSEGGKLYEATQETANDVGTFANLRQLLPAVRNAGIQVIVVPHHRARGGDYAAWMHPNPTQLGGQELMPFAEGTWGGAWNPEFGPQEGDIIVHQHWAQSGFANTDLDFQLKQHGISQIVLVGFVANTCIESTGRFGMELGYHVTLVNDATAAFSRAGMAAAAENGPTFAHSILTTIELLDAIKTSA